MHSKLINLFITFILISYSMDALSVSNRCVSLYEEKLNLNIEKVLNELPGNYKIIPKRKSNKSNEYVDLVIQQLEGGVLRIYINNQDLFEIEFSLENVNTETVRYKYLHENIYQKVTIRNQILEVNEIELVKTGAGRSISLFHHISRRTLKLHFENEKLIIEFKVVDPFLGNYSYEKTYRKMNSDEHIYSNWYYNHPLKQDYNLISQTQAITNKLFPDVIKQVFIREHESGIISTIVYSLKKIEDYFKTKIYEKDFILEMSEAYNLISNQYRARRSEFTPEYLDKLDLDRKEDISRTLHIVSKDELTNEIVATLRLVFGNDNNKLPIEKWLNIDLDYKIKIEPSSFVVVKNKRRDFVFEEMLIQLSRIALHLKNLKIVDPDIPVFFTYGERESKWLYEPLGFKELKTQLPVIKDGISYPVLSASLNDIINLAFLINKSPNKLNPINETHIENTISTNNDPITSLTEMNYRAWESTSVKVIQSNDKIKIPNKIILSILENQWSKIQDRLIFQINSIDTTSNFKGIFFQFLKSQIPLEDNMYFKFQGGYIQYKDGKLNYKKREYDGTNIQYIEMVTDPEFKNIESLNIKVTNSKNVVIYEIFVEI